LFSGSSNALRRATPQVVAAAATGVVANAAKRLWCGARVSRSSECALTFHTEAHAICGAIIGFLLVFCANIAYVKFYEAKTAAGAVYHGLRNVNVCAASFLRPAERGEPGYVEDERERELQMDQTRRDVREINRLVDVLFAFLRTALRERRHGYRVAKNASGGSAKKNGGWRKTRGGGTGFVPDELLVTEDLTGSPSLSTLLFTDAERAKYLTLDPLNRFNVAVADLHRAVERRRETGALYEKAAHEMYRECDVVLAAYKTCERVVTTPIPYQYMHMVNLVLFCFVFSAPFVFSATFDWLTPLPSAVLALGFYGIWEVGKTMMDPFDWNSPCVDLTAIGRRVADEGGGIARAAREEAEKNAHVPGHPAGARGDASGE
jgi:predicted membrane chloride channel (bestrophin family)